MSRSRTIVDSLTADLRDAVRSIRSAPGVAIAAVSILALGIGANAAVWTALRATLLADVDAPEAERLVVARLTMADAGGGVPEPFPWSHPKYRVLREQATPPLALVAGYATRPVTISGGGHEAIRADLQVADPEYFELLGARPALGALYSAQSVHTDPLVAVLSHSLWTTRFDSDRGVLGRAVVVNGTPLSVIGVLPRGFRGLGGESGLWAPFEASPSLLNPRQLEWAHAHWFNVLGRLREGVELEEARARMAAIGQAIAEAHPDPGSAATFGADVAPLSEVRRNRDAEAAVLLLATAAGAVLLIACGNLATLFLSRAAARTRDASIRQALGAGRWRIVRAALVESWVLSSLGAIAGLGVAALGVRALARVWPERFVMGDARIRYADLEPLSLDGSALLVALALAAVASALFGALPAIEVARGRLSGLREAAVGGGSGGRARGLGLQGVLVVVQVALTLVLAASTGLLVQSLLRLSGVPTGVDAPEQVLTARYEIPRSAAAAADPAAFHQRFTERLAALPGVASAAVATASPFSGHDWLTGVRQIDGRLPYPESERPTVGVALVGDRFFETLGIERLAGRTFDPRDRVDSVPVVVLSRSAARELFGREAPIGRSLALGIGLTPSDSDSMAEVIGVVEDVLYERPERGVASEVYVSHRQEPVRYGVLLARTTGDPLELVTPVRAALAELDPDLPLYGAVTLGDLRREGMGDTRVLGSLLGLLAAVALALAAVGTYGTMSCWVDGRGRELGLRVALGARSRQVLALVLARGMAILGVGALIGGVASLVAGRLLQSVLFEVRAGDPVALGGAATLLVGVGLFACWLPARRAGRTDPCAVLRGS